MPRVSLAFVLVLGLLGGCRNQPDAGEQAGADAASRGPGLRSAKPLAGVRELALPDPLGGSSPGLSPTSDGIVLAWMSDVGEPSLKLASLAEGHTDWTDP